MDDKEVLAALAKSELFGDLPDKELRRVVASGKEVAFAAGSDVATSGEDAGRYYLILEGEAEVVVNGERRRTIGAGDGIGEVALVDGGPRTATVTATSPLRTFSLAAWNFKPLLDQLPIAHAVIAVLVRRLRQAQDPAAD